MKEKFVIEWHVVESYFWTLPHAVLFISVIRKHPRRTFPLISKRYSSKPWTLSLDSFLSRIAVLSCVMHTANSFTSSTRVNIYHALWDDYVTSYFLSPRPNVCVSSSSNRWKRQPTSATQIYQTEQKCCSKSKQFNAAAEACRSFGRTAGAATIK